jgi:hypothetical protein
MKCPHCSADIGLFSKEMAELGKANVCPRCRKSVRIGIRQGRFALAFFSIALLSILLGASGPIAAGIAGGVGAAFGLGLKSTLV